MGILLFVILNATLLPFVILNEVKDLVQPNTVILSETKNPVQPSKVILDEILRYPQDDKVGQGMDRK